MTIAEFFNCGIDFLVGNGSEQSHAKFLPCPPFSERLNYYLKLSVDTGYALCKAVGIPDSRFYQWLDGTHYPSIETVDKFASHFKCSIDKFLGRES